MVQSRHLKKGYRVLLIAISMSFLQILIQSSTSFSVTLVIRTFCIVTLSWEGMMTVPTVGLCSASSSLASERTGLHSGSILTHPASSRYWMSPCSERVSEILASCSVGSDSSFESWVRLCHAPSLMRFKKLSIFDNYPRLNSGFCLVVYFKALEPWS